MKKQKICKWDLEYSSVVTVHIPLPNGKTKELKFNIAPDDIACDYVEEQLEDYGYKITY